MEVNTVAMLLPDGSLGLVRVGATGCPAAHIHAATRTHTHTHTDTHALTGIHAYTSY